VSESEIKLHKHTHWAPRSVPCVCFVLAVGNKVIDGGEMALFMAFSRPFVSICSQ